VFTRHKPNKYVFTRATEKNLNRSFADRKPFYLGLKTSTNAAGTESIAEMREEKQENTAHLKTPSTFAVSQDKTNCKTCPPDQAYTASQSPNQPKNFQFSAKTFYRKDPKKISFQPVWFEQ